MKKRVLIIIFIAIILLIIFVPIIVNANKNQNWNQARLKNEVVSNDIVNEILPVQLFDEENYVNDEIPIEEENKSTKDSSNNTTSISQEDKEQYKKWAEEGEEYRKKWRTVNNLLESYYPNEYSKIQETIQEINTNGLNTITLKQYEIDKAELVVKLYNEQNLNSEEKESCKLVLDTYYTTPEGDIKMSDDLKKEIEAIIR